MERPMPRLGLIFGDQLNADHALFDELDPDRDHLLPVTRTEVRCALARFVRTALPNFGDFEDAMSDDEDYLFHSRLSFCLNLGLLNPTEVCDAAEAAWRDGAVPINALYWDSLMRHEQDFKTNPRMKMMCRNLQRMGKERRRRTTKRAEWIRANVESL
jgi:deoxyribodipyrimidine photolyase-like uncharacterized protein